MLDEVSFEALYALFQSNDFASHRPHVASSSSTTKDIQDFVHQAREEGPSIVQDFHESMTVRGGRLYAIIADVCGMANTNGGTLYVGVGQDASKPPTGVSNPKDAIKKLEKEITKQISPPLSCQVDSMETRGKMVLRILVPRGDDPPYAVDDNKIYVRDETDTGLAVRDEIKQLVLRGKSEAPVEPGAESASTPAEHGVAPPRTGVEVVDVEERDNTKYYTLPRSAQRQRGQECHTDFGAPALALRHFGIQRTSRGQDPRQYLLARRLGEIEGTEARKSTAL